MTNLKSIEALVRERPRRKEHSRRSPLRAILALNPYGRAMVKRDMEIIRKIFAEIQNRNSVEAGLVEIPGVEEWIIARHVEMLQGAGLVEGQRGKGPLRC